MRASITLIFLGLLTCPNWAIGVEKAPPFETYKIILDRNIFDSTRSPLPSPRNRQREEIRPDRIRLTGVFISRKEAVAFFEGSRSQFNSALRPNERIGGLRLLEIRTNHVKLAKNNQILELPINAQMERTGDREWAISTSTTTIQESASTSARPAENRNSAKQDPTTTGAPSKTEGASDDLIKRLMERRKKEMGQ